MICNNESIAPKIDPTVIPCRDKKDLAFLCVRASSCNFFHFNHEDSFNLISYLCDLKISCRYLLIQICYAPDGTMCRSVCD